MLTFWDLQHCMLMGSVRLLEAGSESVRAGIAPRLRQVLALEHRYAAVITDRTVFACSALVPSPSLSFVLGRAQDTLQFISKVRSNRQDLYIFHTCIVIISIYLSLWLLASGVGATSGVEARLPDSSASSCRRRC